MTDTQNTAPERITARVDYDGEWDGQWCETGREPLGVNAYYHAEYIRADLHERLVSEAVAAAVQTVLDDVGYTVEQLGEDTRALIEDPSTLAKRDARMKAEGMREAVEFLEKQPLDISGQMNSVADVLQLVSSALLARADEIEKGGA